MVREPEWTTLPCLFLLTDVERASRLPPLPLRGDFGDTVDFMGLVGVAGSGVTGNASSISWISSPLPL